MKGISNHDANIVTMRLSQKAENGVQLRDHELLLTFYVKFFVLTGIFLAPLMLKFYETRSKQRFWKGQYTFSFSYLKVYITYRKKKSGLSMRVTGRGEVRVSAPIGMPEKQVISFVESNRQWIENALKRVAETVDRKDRFYGRLPLATRGARLAANIRLHAIVAPLVEKYSDEMQVRVSGISYKANRSNWGSCNPRTRHLNFSVYLLLLPVHCIEHVVVHELVHLLVPNHGPAFHAVMDRYFPRWREARAETREIVHRGGEPE